MKQRTISLDDTSLAWLAGILEGEGSFIVVRNHVGGKIYLYPMIEVNMTDQDIIVRVSDMFGTKPYGPFQQRQGRRKPFWRACVSGSPAANLMNQLLPVMGERRSAQVVSALDRSHRPGVDSGNGDQEEKPAS